MTEFKILLHEVLIRTCKNEFGRPLVNSFALYLEEIEPFKEFVAGIGN